MQYEDDDMLMLSGIQHFAFCPRQWALIHIDQQWRDNLLTAEGQIMHQHADDSFYRQKVGDKICLRSVNIASKRLGLYGISDIIELLPTNSCCNAIIHPLYPGYWIPYPVEYKHGKPKADSVDIVQLTAQAICLEEQYNINIYEGAIYYGETRHREIVSFDCNIRSKVVELAQSMHVIYDSGIVPFARKQPYCKSCSLKDVCMPETAYKESASNYLKSVLYEETT